MSYLEYHSKSIPKGVRKLLYVHWPLVLLVTTVAIIGFLMLYSVAGGAFEPWASAQMQRFALGMAVMFIFAMIPIYFWRNISMIAYVVALLLLIAVEVMGQVGMGAQRWIDIGPLRLQPSELAKIGVVMALAAYYDWLPGRRISHPVSVLGALVIICVPAALTFMQPDLGTALLIVLVGAVVMFVAGVHWGYFTAVFAIGVSAIGAVFQSRGTPWQLLKDYQYRRIDTFLDPSSDPLGAGYHITQSKIALGSGGLSGRGFMQGTQSRLNFLPEKHTDFIFTTLAEEFGFVGAGALLLVYALIIGFCIFAAMRQKDKFAALLIYGLAANFFLYFAVNMSMVMGLAPVVGVPLPLVSYGGSAMLVLLAGFGLIQSAHIHRPR